MAKWMAQDLQNGEWVNTTGHVYDDTNDDDAKAVDFLRAVANLFNAELESPEFRVLEVSEVGR